MINLERSPERRARISEQLAQLGLPFELIEAVDGRQLSGPLPPHIYDPLAALREFGRELTAGEIGCCLSHLGLYRRLIESDLEEALILEDDAILNPALPELLRLRERLPPDWELIYFHQGDSATSIWGRRPLDERHRCVRFSTLAFGTWGYLLRRSGARKLLEHGFPIRMPADYLTGGHIRTGVRLYGIDPPCVRHPPSDAAGSTMPEAYQFHPRWPSREELGPLLWPLHRLKWSLLHFYQKTNPFSLR